MVLSARLQKLGLTQPAVSKIINDIEDYFGVELVVRKKYRCNINTCRSIVTLRSESITREMKNMVNEISGMSSEAVVEVSFGFPSLIGFTFMSGMINKFKEVFPKRRFLCMKRNCLRSYRQSATVDWILRLVR